MKNILLSAAAIALTLSACDNTPKYTINGTITGGEPANVYLLAMEGRNIDTLAKAPVTNGKFQLTGSIAEVTPAFIVAEGVRNRDLIFVENNEFTANLNLENPAENKITGTPNQEIVGQYMALANETSKAAQGLQQAYRTAYQEKDEAKIAELQQQYESLMQENSAKENEVTKANADSYVAAYLLYTKLYNYSYEELVEKFNLLGENAKATKEGKQIAERINNLSKTAIGQVAPDFTLNTPEGEPLSMHSIKGKVKVIDFWASWCSPCRGENPNVVKMYEKYHPKGLEILSVSLDNDKEAWLKAIKEDNLTWNHVSDLKGWESAAAQLYCVNAIPHLVVLDENNVIVAKDLRGEELQNKVAEMLK